LTEDAQARAAFLAPLGVSEAMLDLTDGLRMTLPDARVVHIRPSGNAPELRLYVEACDAAEALDLMQRALAQLRRAIVHAGY
jgi:phosphomannomutase